jgi:hypothetical protein
MMAWDLLALFRSSPAGCGKNSASSVLARHGRLTISAAFTDVTRGIQRVVHLRGSP